MADNQISKQELQFMILRFYKLDRSYNRLFQTLSIFAESIGKGKVLKEAYLKVFRDEKKQLLSILEKQIKYLEKIDAPPFIIATKSNEIQAAKEIVAEIEIKGSETLFNQELTKLKDDNAQESFDLTTNFVSDSDFPFNLFFDRDDDNEKWKHDLIKT